MKLILLSGQSLDNKDWIEEVKRAVKTKYSDSHIQYYEHWRKENGTADVELETERFIDLVDTLSEEYIIFAKSIGSVIFLNSLKKLKHLPKKVILIGVPFHLAMEKGYNFKTLNNLAAFPIYIYQKKNDPYCSYNDLVQIQGDNVSINEYQCVEEEDNNHAYINMDTLSNLL